MTKQSDRWLKSMMTRYKTDAAGVAEIMRERQRLSRAHPNNQKGQHQGGFNKLTKAELSEIGRKGAAKRWSKPTPGNDTNPSTNTTAAQPQ